MKKTKTQFILFIISAVILLVVISSLGGSGEEEASGKPVSSNSSKAERARYPSVTTLGVVRAKYESTVTGFGVAHATKVLNLTSEVAGTIQHLSPNFYSGTRYQVGDVLAKIDDVRYQENLANARLSLASAETELLQQELNQEQAIESWEKSGLSGEPDSDLVLFKPQVKSAKSRVEYAKKTLARAESDLNKTEIKVPFNAVITSRDIELGSNVQVGTLIGQFYGTDQIEISIPLSDRQWSILPDLKSVEKPWKVKVHNDNNNQQWEGVIDRIEQHLDETSQQRALIITIDKPLEQSTPLYPGTFVRAEINGLTVENVWKIPSSSISQNNQFWFVDSNDLLQKSFAKVHFTDENSAYVTPIENIEVADIVVHPLRSYLSGMRVVKKHSNSEDKTSLQVTDSKDIADNISKTMGGV